MDTFLWDARYETGLPEVDAQHRELVRIISHFGNLVTQTGGPNAAVVDAVILELETYAGYHFTFEESVMMDAGLVPAYVGPHQDEHQSFLDQLAALRTEARALGPRAAEQLFSFLTHWLVHHILGCDRGMARQVLAVRQGMAPEDALAAHTPTLDDSVAPLLAALNGLFQMVAHHNQELQERNRSLEVRVAERTTALATANRHLSNLAMTDALTGLPNRRHGVSRLQVEWEATNATRRPVSVIMADLDGFRQVIDAHGHAAGDGVIRAVGRALEGVVRPDDLVCRMGGDEFMIVCHDTHQPLAAELAEAVRATVEALQVQVDGLKVWQGSISLGVAGHPSPARRPEDLIKAAEAAVYVAKSQGRNRVCQAEVPLAPVVRLAASA